MEVQPPTGIIRGVPGDVIRHFGGEVGIIVGGDVIG